MIGSGSEAPSDRRTFTLIILQWLPTTNELYGYFYLAPWKIGCESATALPLLYSCFRAGTGRQKRSTTRIGGGVRAESTCISPTAERLCLAFAKATDDEHDRCRIVGTHYVYAPCAWQPFAAPAVRRTANSVRSENQLPIMCVCEGGGVPAASPECLSGVLRQLHGRNGQVREL